MKIKNIEITNPYILKIDPYTFIKNLSSIDNYLELLKKKLNLNKIPFYGSVRLGLSSVDDYSIISYDTLNIGDQLIYKRFKGLKYIYDIIEITYKHDYIIFFKSLIDNKKSYIDLGANEMLSDYKNIHNLPIGYFYPIIIQKPKYIEIKWDDLPKMVKIETI